MSFEIHADYEQRFLFPPDLEEWVPAGHPARFVREFVDSLGLQALGFKFRETEDGRPNYSSEVLLKIWLYGYMNRVRSSRQLERMCLNDIGMLWLTGMNYPDHNTIWRFFRDHKPSFKEVFRQTVRVAAKMELVELVLNAVDGTKILADVAKKKSYFREDLLKLLDNLDDEHIEDYCKEVECNEEMEKGRKYRLPEELQDREALRKEIKKQLEKLDKAGAKQLNKTDEDARMIKTEQGKKFCYNAQASVDEKAGIITSTGVSQDAMDSHLLMDSIEEVIENLDGVPDETVADSGYFSGEQLAKAESMGIEVLVNIKSTPSFGRQSANNSEYHQSKFTYNEHDDSFSCPKGGTLSYRGEKKYTNKNYKAKYYSCDNYRECPFRNECTKSNRGRTIAVSPYSDAVYRQLEKQKEPSNKDLLLRR